MADYTDVLTDAPTNRSVQHHTYVDPPARDAPDTLLSGHNGSRRISSEPPEGPASGGYPPPELASDDSDCEFLPLSDDDGVGILMDQLRSARQSFSHSETALCDQAEDVPILLRADDLSTLRLPVTITTSTFLVAVLREQMSLVASLHAVDGRIPNVVITPDQLRRLLMKAVVWYIDRECIADIEQAYVVFVGSEYGQPMDHSCPASGVGDLRALADGLNDLDTTIDDFDAYMFHGGRYAPSSSIVVLEVIAHALVGAGIMCLMIAYFPSIIM
ncbi:hypothetical protein C2E23DRAFT_883096 [Lenzites betulinus]|nr:hypothetical protein C2E23DRAFT_883096 [Lenzites betulinus]